MRPRFHEPPTSRLATWSRALAVFSIPVMLLAIVIVRSGLLELTPALATFGGALLLAFCAIVLALAAFLMIWREGHRGFGQALLGLLIGTAMLAYPCYLGTRAYRLPALADITTDPIDPPRFELVARLRPRDANSTAYAGLHAAELQRVAYPDIEPLIVSATPHDAFEAVLAVMKKRRWLVINQHPPDGGRQEGMIEAVARTPIMGFRDDVAVRIRANEEGARVDVRSASRYGHVDFGTNAARVHKLIDEVDDFVGTENERSRKAAQKAGKGETPPKKGQAPAR
jgi:uncharacterized protein (DUF1499 family)